MYDHIHDIETKNCKREKTAISLSSSIFCFLAKEDPSSGTKMFPGNITLLVSYKVSRTVKQNLNFMRSL